MSLGKQYSEKNILYLVSSYMYIVLKVGTIDLRTTHYVLRCLINLHKECFSFTYVHALRLSPLSCYRSPPFDRTTSCPEYCHQGDNQEH